MTTTMPNRSATPRAQAGRRQLSRRWRHAVLIVHIIAAGSWIGIGVIVAVLTGIGAFSSDTRLRAVAYQALANFIVPPMLTVALICLASGVLLGLGTKWGLLRHWWVAIKLTINVAFCVLIVVILAPGMPETEAYGAALLTGDAPDFRVTGTFFPPIVEFLMLTSAVILSVVKPWGRIRRLGGTPS